MLLTCEDRRTKGGRIVVDVVNIEDIGTVYDEVEGGNQSTTYQYGMVDGIGHMIISSVFTPDNGGEIETDTSIDDLSNIPLDKKRQHVIDIYERNKVMIPNPGLSDPTKCIVYKTGATVELQIPFIELYAQITSYKDDSVTCSSIQYCEVDAVGYFMLRQDYSPNEPTESDVPKTRIFIDSLDDTPENKKRDKVISFCENLHNLSLAKIIKWDKADLKD